jgi:hypothetical protein
LNASRSGRYHLGKVIQEGIQDDWERGCFASAARLFRSCLIPWKKNWPFLARISVGFAYWNSILEILLFSESSGFERARNKANSLLFLRPIVVPGSLNSVLVPHSIRNICGNFFRWESSMKSLAFEHESKLECIGRSACTGCPLQCIFIPRSVDCIGSEAFARCRSVACIYFYSHSSLWQLKSASFSPLSNLRAITIPSSIRQLHSAAFSGCHCLFCFTF